MVQALFKIALSGTVTRSDIPGGDLDGTYGTPDAVPDADPLEPIPVFFGVDGNAGAPDFVDGTGAVIAHSNTGVANGASIPIWSGWLNQAANIYGFSAQQQGTSGLYNCWGDNWPSDFGYTRFMATNTNINYYSAFCMESNINSYRVGVAYINPGPAGEYGIFSGQSAGGMGLCIEDDVIGTVPFTLGQNNEPEFTAGAPADSSSPQSRNLIFNAITNYAGSSAAGMVWFDLDLADGSGSFVARQVVGN